MADLTLNVLLPNVLNDATTSNGVKTINPYNKQSVEVGNANTTDETLAAITTLNTKVTINDAMANKNNSMYIVANVATPGKLTIKAGDAYPNRCLGDYKTLSLGTGINVIQLEDISRFENRDDTIIVEGDGEIVANLFVIGKRVGVDTVANQNDRDLAAGRTLHYDPSYTGE